MIKSQCEFHSFCEKLEDCSWMSFNADYECMQAHCNYEQRCECWKTIDGQTPGPKTTTEIEWELVTTPSPYPMPGPNPPVNPNPPVYPPFPPIYPPNPPIYPPMPPMYPTMPPPVYPPNPPMYPTMPPVQPPYPPEVIPEPTPELEGNTII